MTAIKRCPRCGQVKAAEAFYRRRGRRLSSYCQPCTRAASHEGRAAGGRTRPPRPSCGWWIGVRQRRHRTLGARGGDGR